MPGDAPGVAAATAAAANPQPTAAAAPAAKGVPQPLGPFTDADYEADAAHYKGLPLGLLHPTVIPYGSVGAHPELTAGRHRLLCYFMHRHLEFRLPEVESIAAAAGRRASRGAGVPGSRAGANGSSSSGGERPAVVWEKPFGDRVRPHLLCVFDCLPAVYGLPASVET